MRNKQPKHEILACEREGHGMSHPRGFCLCVFWGPYRVAGWFAASSVHEGFGTYEQQANSASARRSTAKSKKRVV